jgi:hypothetical protein
MVYFTFLSLEEYGADDGLYLFAQRVPRIDQHGRQHRALLDLWLLLASL